MIQGYCPSCRRSITYANPPPIQTVAWDRELPKAYYKAVQFGSTLGYRVPRRKIVFRGGTFCVQVHNETSNPPYSLIHVDGEPPTHLHPESRRLIHEIVIPEVPEVIQPKKNWWRRLLAKFTITTDALGGNQ